MLTKPPHCAVFLTVTVVGSAAATTSLFLGTIIGEQMTLHANPEEKQNMKRREHEMIEFKVK